MGQPPRKSEVFIAERNALGSRFPLVTIDTQMTLALLQELLIALSANDADGYKSWLNLGIYELGRDVAGEVESEWIVPLLVEEARRMWDFRFPFWQPPRGTPTINF